MPIFQEFRDFVTSFSFPDNFLGFWGSAPSEAGVTVNEMSAMQSAAVVGSIRIISGLLASCPLNIYEVDYEKGTKKVAYDHDLQYLLNTAPNPETDAFIFRQTIQIHLLLTGNAYLEKVYDKGGRLAALYQRSPFRTWPYRVMDKTQELVFKTTDSLPNGTERMIRARDMVHIKWMALDGLVGMNPIKSFAREIIGLDIGARAFGARLFANDATPSGVLTTDKILKDDSKKKLEASWKSGHGGSQAHKFAVLDGGLKWEKISLTAEESQFLLTRGYQRNEIAACIFGVPVHLLGDREESGKNSHEQMLGFLNNTLKPWMRCHESAFNMKLLPELGRNTGRHIIAYDSRELERADFETMLKALSTGRQWGIYTADEGRAELGLNPYEAKSDKAADQLWQPVNMIVAQDAGAPPVATQPGAQQESSISHAKDVYYRVFRDAFTRICANSKWDNKVFTRAFSTPLLGLSDYFYMDGDPDFRSGNAIPEEVLAFCTDYMGAMQTRAKDWTDSDEQAKAELDRAVRAIQLAVSREIAARKAKESK